MKISTNFDLVENDQTVNMLILAQFCVSDWHRHAKNWLTLANIDVNVNISWIPTKKY